MCCVKAQRRTFDKGSKPFDDGRMDAISKEVLDARLETVETKMDGRIATLEVKIDGKFSGVDAQFAGVDAQFAGVDAHFAEVNVQFAGVDAKFAGVDVKFAGVDVKFAELRTEMQKGFADMTKWIVGTVVGVAAVTITIRPSSSTTQYRRPQQPQWRNRLLSPPMRSQPRQYRQR